MDDPEATQQLSERLLLPNDEEPASASASSPNSQIKAETPDVNDIIVDPHLHLHGDRDRQESQTSQYRDRPFALLFVGQAVLVCCLALFMGLPAMWESSHQIEGDETEAPAAASEEDRAEDSDEDLQGESLWGFFVLLSIISTLSIGIAAVSLDFMTHHAESLMQITLMISCLILGVIVLLLFAEGAPGYGFLGLFVLICTALYAYSVQRRIAFAAANLKTALSAIQTNYGLCMMAYAFSAVANLWVATWTLACLGIFFEESEWVFASGHYLDIRMNSYVVIFMILSYYWTSQVLQNIIHVTVSGVIGTWWFAPQEAQSAFSPAIVDSFSRATTYSFGSICLGSLLVAIIQTIEQIVQSFRRQQPNSMFLCIMECLMKCLERIGSFFNKWAFVYVGLYGYNYLTAGRKALELFKSRGWSSIITDNLAYRMLMLTCVVVGAISGMAGMVLSDMTGWADALLGESAHVSMFGISYIIGFSLSSILMGVVISGVDSVIVCFAEAPEEFETHHPALYRNMVNAWSQVYPQECGFQ